MKQFWLTLCLLCLPLVAHAEFFVCYTTATGVFTRYNPSVDPTQLTVGAGETCAQVSEANIPAQQTLLTGAVPKRHLKVVSGLAVEMSQAEKDAVDAPLLAQQAALQALRDELQNDNVCNLPTLADINNAINAREATAAASLDSVKATLDTQITAATNLAEAKTALLALNAAYNTAMKGTNTMNFNLFQKVARCMLARARVRG